MKRIILILVLILSPVVKSFGQEKGFASYYGARGSILGNSEMEIYDFNAGMGYNFIPELNVSVEADFTVALYKRDNIKTYYKGGTLGGSVGYNFLRRDYYTLEARVALGNTVGGSEWTFLYYDAGIRFSVGRSMHKMMCGAGVRHHNSHKPGFRNYTNGYLSFGVKFN